MKVEEIEKLLVDYYEGKTTESQEEVLKTYFRTQQVPEHLKQERRLFLSFRNDEKRDVPPHLEEKLIRMINEKDEETKRFFRRNKTQRNWKWISGLTASLLLLIGLGYGINHLRNSQEIPQDTFTNPKEAYCVLQATLVEVSTDLNNGIDQVRDTRQEIKQIQKQIKKEIQ